LRKLVMVYSINR